MPRFRNLQSLSVALGNWVAVRLLLTCDQSTIMKQHSCDYIVLAKYFTATLSDIMSRF